MNAGSHQQEQLRLFLALPIPDEISAEMRRVQQKLQPLPPRRSVRWTRPDQFHLTLKFLGNVPASDTAVLCGAVRAVCEAAPPMFLRAEGTGFFPNDRSPRVFWAGIKSDDGQLFQFQQRLDAAVAKFAEKADRKQFAAHITLARMERLSRNDAEKFAARTQTIQNFGEWTARQIELVQSTLSPSGAEHAIFATFATKNV